MNSIVTSASGLDILIKSIQGELYDILTLSWSGDIRGFGRVYKNKKDGSLVPEWYDGETEYVPVYYDDNYSAHFFFIDGDKHESKDETVFTTKLKIAFMVNLDAILPLETERADAKVQDQLVRRLREISDGRYTITGLEKGLDNIFQGFDKSQIQFTDMHPYHSFAVLLDVNYFINY